MAFWAAFWHAILSILMFLGARLLDWLFVFVSPIKNLHILWIIVPIWINWFFTEFFQEKKGTSLGNAITNGAVMLWVGIDWVRYLINELTDGSISFGWNIVSLFFLCIIVIAIGLFIILEGLKVQQFIKVVGRVRETTYLLLMFSPVIYGIIPLTFNHIIAVVIYFPLFYFLIEWIVRITPNPKTYES